MLWPDLDVENPFDSLAVVDEGEYFCRLFDESSDSPAGAETEWFRSRDGLFRDSVTREVVDPTEEAIEETGVVRDRGVAEAEDDDDPPAKGAGIDREGKGGFAEKPFVKVIVPLDPPPPKPLDMACLASGCEPLLL